MPGPIDIYCDEFPVLSETFVVNEARQLQRLGHEVTIIAGRRPEQPAADVRDLRVRYVEDDTSRVRARAMVRLLATHPGGVVRDRLARRRWAREETPRRLRELAPAILARDPGTHIHVHFAAGAALDALRIARITGARWSLTAHAYDIYLLPRNLPEKLRTAGFSTSGCDYTVRDLRRIGGPEAQVERIVMGIDPERFVRSTPHPDAGFVLAVGRLTEKKGFRHLIEAAAQLPGTRVVIVGDGPLRGALQADIDRLGAPVELVGAKQPAEIKALLEEAAVFAMPCVVAADGDRDSMPVVVKEAMAMEVPVVVTDEVGLPELVTPACGRLVAPGDAAALAQALREVLDDPGRAVQGRAGRARVQAVADVRTETRRLSRLIEGGAHGGGDHGAS